MRKLTFISKYLYTLCILALLLTSACGKQFQTVAIDSSAPTSSNPFIAEKQRDLNGIYNDQSLETLSFCKSSELNGFSNFKKKEFVCALLPGAIRMNRQVYKQRLQVQALLEKSRVTSLSVDEVDWLNRIKLEYQLNQNSSLEALLVRVDIVPLSLLMAQAAIESGWGTSRAAIQGKNLFGIHGSINTDQCLLAQKAKNICIKKYSTTTEGISDYIQFLNTMNSAKSFRQIRAQFRSAGTSLDPVKLAQTLSDYSELGQQYVRQVSDMMLGQNFIRFDTEADRNS